MAQGMRFCVCPSSLSLSLSLFSFRATSGQILTTGTRVGWQTFLAKDAWTVLDSLANHLNGLKEAQKALGISDDQVLCKYNVPETEDAYEAAIDADQGASAMIRSVLLALIDIAHPELDYLRADRAPAPEAKS